MKNTYIFALIFLLVLGYFLYVYFGIIFIVFIPPVFVYLSSIIKSSILFTLPKLIINGTIDEFFATDSWKFYWDALPGINYLQYVPNGNHGLLGSYQTPTIFSFYDRLIHSKSLPKMEWEIKEETFYISTDPNMPYQINLWTCTNPKARDFRSWEVGRSWKKEAIAVDCSGNYHIKTPWGKVIPLH